MVGDQLGIGHDPGQRAAYVKSWVQVLKEDPKEILRASRDADKIRDSLSSLLKERAYSNLTPLPQDAEVPPQPTLPCQATMARTAAGRER